MFFKVGISHSMAVVLSSLIASGVGAGAESANSSGRQYLKQVERKYANAKSLRAHVDKTLKLSILKKQKDFVGTLNMKAGEKFRLEFSKPSRAILLINKEAIWNVQYPEDPEFDDTVRVLKVSRPKSTEPQTLLAFVLVKGQILKFFNIRQSGMNGDFFHYTLIPKKPSNQFKKLNVEIDRKNKVIVSLRYWDHIDNMTELKFSKIEFDKKIADSLFVFEKPKNSEVTEI